MSKTINHSMMVNSTPQELYEVLLDSKKHAQLIGSDATISPDVGGEFSVFGNAIMGHNVELLPGQKIVQKWRAGSWEEGHYSTATFELKEATAAPNSSSLNSTCPTNTMKASTRVGTIITGARWGLCSEHDQPTCHP